MHRAVLTLLIKMTVPASEGLPWTRGFLRRAVARRTAISGGRPIINFQAAARLRSRRKANSVATDKRFQGVETRRKTAKLRHSCPSWGTAVPISMYSVSVPIFIQHLTALSNILD